MNNNKINFINYINSIGFEFDKVGSLYLTFDKYLYIGNSLKLKRYSIDIVDDHYYLNTEYQWIGGYELDDLTPFKVFKKELRSIKLKQLLK